MKKQGGLIVSIYRDADGHDCTNGGITSKFTEALAIGDGIPEIFDRREGMPTVRVSKYCGYWRAVPVDDPRTDGRWVMFGGNFIHTSDSRFPSPYPIPVHDRIEN